MSRKNIIEHQAGHILIWVNGQNGCITLVPRPYGKVFLEVEAEGMGMSDAYTFEEFIAITKEFMRVCKIMNQHRIEAE